MTPTPEELDNPSLLRAVIMLSVPIGARQLQRSHLYAAVGRLTLHLSDILRCGDKVEFGGRTYELMRATKLDGQPFYPFTVNNGRGPAMLGEKIVNKAKQGIAFASFDEHLFFAENAARIIDLFGSAVKQDTKRIELAESTAIEENHHAERIV